MAREPKRPEWRTCPQCGDEFHVTFRWTQGRPRAYCERCRPQRVVAERVTLSERLCAWCSAPFMPRTARHVCCSARCNYARRDRKRSRPRGTTVTSSCAKCGTSFEYLSNTRPRLYCTACRPAYVPVARPAQVCQECSASFTPAMTGQRFCSDRCRYTAKNRRRGEGRLDPSRGDRGDRPVAKKTSVPHKGSR
jgi:predicted nucleic acid-binding Zn ribbon protein